MSDIFEQPDEAATPLTDSEKRDLKPAYITTRVELNAAEQENIALGQDWALRRKRDLLTESFVKSLHLHMFNDVWRWAGRFRTSERNIGIDHWEIPIALVAPRAETGRKRWCNWQVVPEHNLDPFFIPDDVLCGVEIVSPPLAFDEFETSLRALCDFVMCFGHTDLNCGIHFNVSVPKIDQLDPVKAGLLTPDIELLRRFKRSHHPGILSFRHELAMRASQCPIYLGANSGRSGLDALGKLLPVGKETSLNLQPWCEGLGYVEYRQCGGADWEYRYEALLQAAMLCAESLAAACDPTARRRSLSARERQLRDEALFLRQGGLTDYARLRQREPDWAVTY